MAVTCTKLSETDHALILPPLVLLSGVGPERALQNGIRHVESGKVTRPPVTSPSRRHSGVSARQLPDGIVGGLQRPVRILERLL